MTAQDDTFSKCGYNCYVKISREDTDELTKTNIISKSADGGGPQS